MIHFFVKFILFIILLVFASCETEEDFAYFDDCIDIEQDMSDVPDNLSLPQWAFYDSLIITKVELYMSNEGINVSMQGGDAYNGYFFQFQDRNANVFIFDIEQKQLIQTISLPPVNKNHCNNASFSRFFYEEGDEYPLLYVSDSNTGSYNHVQVYRITRPNILFNIEKVQEFILPDATDDNYLYFTDVIIDNYSECMYVTSKGSNNDIETGRVCKYNIPDPHKDGVFALRETCIVDSFFMPRLKHHQGAMIVGKKMYIAAGVPGWGTPPELVVVDLEQKRLAQRIDLREYGYNIEPEAIFLHKDTIYISSNRSRIHKIIFDDKNEN